jgi:hypothetical protein
MNTYDLAQKNYGRTWTMEMLAALVAKGKLTPGQYEEITGEVYVA